MDLTFGVGIVQILTCWGLRKQSSQADAEWIVKCGTQAGKWPGSFMFCTAVYRYAVYRRGLMAMGNLPGEERKFEDKTNERVHYIYAGMAYVEKGQKLVGFERMIIRREAQSV